MADGVEQVESSSSLAPRLISLLVLFANAWNVPSIIALKIISPVDGVTYTETTSHRSRSK